MAYTDLPNDPFMLLSFINMKLRDCYQNLDELCEDLDIDRNKLILRMRASGFEYDSIQNKFW
ncbi:MAG: DUF4250 domain-containing protein [Muribaculaceae bacterium]|nr:DUF4250 domain-containing protein [Muribaculaceae bacterium]